ncbi:hypothetical protein [Flavobacterium sp. KACC 22763]|uniref:hypothetical protein n=1 Tax=Flavobacterium sp. KACC 22763 TaxID=3025668 RepID=UPI00236714A7|nr:hypothetical protein [Flavobacterium sp. KACC 22763]WDF65806.1 hypothetical protein PQ463_06485 [Flavobacterium sp. KACC 22763]
MVRKKNPTHIRKIIKCKPAVISALRNNLKKDLKKPVKSIAEAEKGSTFAPATAKNALRHSAAYELKTGRNFQKKDSKKLAGKEKAFYICTPQNTESSLRYW